MDNRAEIRDFLGTRRAKVTPDRAGLVSYGPRRVAGLRRSEVAQLAAVSVEYYTRMERGNLAGVSDAVLESVSSALQLDEAEHALYDLVRAANQGATPARRRGPARSQQVGAHVLQLIDALHDVPVFVHNGSFPAGSVPGRSRSVTQPT